MDTKHNSLFHNLSQHKLLLPKHTSFHSSLLSLLVVSCKTTFGSVSFLDLRDTYFCGPSISTTNLKPLLKQSTWRVCRGRPRQTVTEEGGGVRINTGLKWTRILGRKLESQSNTTSLTSAPTLPVPSLPILTLPDVSTLILVSYVLWVVCFVFVEMFSIRPLPFGTLSPLFVLYPGSISLSPLPVHQLLDVPPYVPPPAVRFPWPSPFVPSPLRTTPVNFSIYAYVWRGLRGVQTMS